MNGDETAEQRREAAGWLAIAREDVRVARACLALDPPAFGMAAYHCQQAAEKLTKGLLAAAGVPFRKTHDLNELADLAAAHYPAARQVLDVIRPFTVWGFAYRYPTMEDEPEPVPGDADLRRALDIVAELAERLQNATASEHQKPGPNAGPEAG
jgi:HEPN domain-containing protein